MRALLLALASLALTAPAAAQDGSEASGARTPENAQKFLEVAADKFGLTMEGTEGLTSGRFDPAQLRYGNVQISSEGKCRTRFDGTVTEFFIKDSTQTIIASGAGTSAATIDALGKKYGYSSVRTAPWIIDWSTVTKVGVATDYDPQNGTREVPAGAVATSPSQSITLIGSSEEIGNRLRLAMETLRVACDPAADTGF